MLTHMKKRRYTLKKRAKAQRDTRERIVEALMALHEELGPRNTTISAIAERAGVQRLTVYRHFPDETELLQACTSRWLELNPPPDPATWGAVSDARERARRSLRAIYGYFRSTERMWRVSLRDEAEVPALQGPMKAFRAYLDAIAEDVLLAFTGDAASRPLAAATARHAVQFHTWASLAEQGLDDTDAAALAAGWLQSALASVGTAPGDSDSSSAGEIAAISVVLRDESGRPVLEGTSTLRPARRPAALSEE